MLYLCGPPRSKDNPPEQGTVNWLELTLSGNYTRLVLSKRPGQSILPMIHSLTSQQKVLAKIMLDFIDGNIWGGGGVTWSNIFIWEMLSIWVNFTRMTCTSGADFWVRSRSLTAPAHQVLHVWTEDMCRISHLLQQGHLISLSTARKCD